jgi:hypothetical protein
VPIETVKLRRVVLKGQSGSFNVYSRSVIVCQAAKVQANTSYRYRLLEQRGTAEVLSVGAGVVDAIELSHAMGNTAFAAVSRQVSRLLDRVSLSDRNSTRNKLPLNNY